MEKYEIIQEMGKSYLIINDETPDDCVYVRQMLTYNRIPGIVACQKGLYDNRPVLKYDITNMKTLDKAFNNRQMSFDDFREIFEHINRTIKNGRAYLFDDNGYLFWPEHIYLDMETEKICLIYVPFPMRRTAIEIEQGRYYRLADYILEKINHRDEHAVSVAYQFYRMSKEDFFSLESFSTIIEREKAIDSSSIRHESLSRILPGDKNDRYDIAEISESRTDRTDRTDRNEHSYIYEDEANDMEDTDEENTGENSKIIPIAAGVLDMIIVALIIFVPAVRGYLQQMIMAFVICSVVGIISTIRLIIQIRNRKRNDIETIPNGAVTVEEFWTDDAATQFFDVEAEENKYSLTWDDNGMTRVKQLSKSETILGKKYDEVDLCIPDPSVSRRHAKITLIKDGAWIQDLNSTNGTFVNGIRLVNGESVKIDKTSEIRFGKVAVSVV